MNSLIFKLSKMIWIRRKNCLQSHEHTWNMKEKECVTVLSRNCFARFDLIHLRYSCTTTLFTLNTSEKKLILLHYSIHVIHKYLWWILTDATVNITTYVSAPHLFSHLNRICIIYILSSCALCFLHDDESNLFMAKFQVYELKLLGRK